MATETAEVTICPNCEARIPKKGMSLCPYCAFPLGKKSDASEEDRSPIVKRLLGMEEKPEFAEAKNQQPPWTPEYTKAANRQMHGRVLLVLGLIIAGLEFVIGGGAVLSFLVIAGGLLAAFGIYWILQAAATHKRLDSQTVLTRSAFVVQRRSETLLHGDVNYYYLIQFGDGSEGEFVYAGRGPSEEPYTNSMTGAAFTRGPELLYIARVRA